MRLIFSIIAVFSSYHCLSNNVPDDIEFQALKDIYQNLNGANWNNKTNWPATWPVTATSAEFGTWFGVTVQNGDIVQLSLNSNNLAGSLPSSIGNLTSLTLLYLHDNHLTGGIPSELGSLSYLQYLYLNGNQLTGSIPSSVGNLSSLLVFSLQINQLSGSIPSSIGNLSLLQDLDFSSNNLSGSLPSSLGNLTSLTSLKLNNNSITGSIPSTIGSMSNVSLVYLHNNQLTGNIPSELGSLTHLQYLYLNGNQLSGSIPSSVGNLSSLLVFSLWNNQLSGSIPSSIGNLSLLQDLDFSSNNLSGSLPSSLGNLTSLTSLKLNNNSITGSIPSTIGSMSNVSLVYLHNNQLTGNIPSELGSLTHLQYLYLNGNQLSGSIPSSVGNLLGLLVFSLSNNQLSGSIPSSIGNLSQLQTLDFSFNNLSGSVPSSLGNLTALMTLILQSNSLTGSIPPTLGSMSSLTTLFLHYNQLSGSVPGELRNLSVSYLALSHNKLTSFPDYSTVPNKSNLFIWVANNRIPFGDLENYFTNGNTPFAVFDCASQLSNLPDTVKIVSGHDLVIAPANPGQYSTIAWQKQVNGTWNNVNNINEDATQKTFKKTQPAASDFGTYKVSITNSKVPGTIDSGPIVIKNVEPTDSDDNVNWQESITYKYNDASDAGTVAANSRVYSDAFGNVVQSQTKSIANNTVFASESIYDNLGNQTLTTLPAPINSSTFGYKGAFTTNSTNAKYSAADFDKPIATNAAGEVNNPNPVASNGMGTLGWYYSSANTLEPNTPTTDYPYARSYTPAGPNPTTTKSASAGDAYKMGSTHESQGEKLQITSTELSHYYTLRPYFNASTYSNVLMSIPSAANNSYLFTPFGLGIFNTLWTDNSNNVYVAKSSGSTVSNHPGIYPINGAITVTPGTTCVLQVTGFSTGSATANVHITDASGNDLFWGTALANGNASQTISFTFTIPAGVTSIKIGAQWSTPVTTGAIYISSVQLTAASGAPAGNPGYKMISTNPDGKRMATFTDADGNTLASAVVTSAAGVLPVAYDNNTWSYNFYNDLGQLVASVAPNGVNTASTAMPNFVTRYKYDHLGRLIETTSPDEGTSQFVYSTDGKIRFSQNQEQRTASTPRFSYTNYDDLGRLIESGEYVMADSRCVSCSALQTSLSQYISQYGNAAMSNTAQVTSYLNTSLSQSFSDQQYQAAFKNCNLTAAYANFNGSGFITFGKQPQYQVGTNDFSVEAWINLSNSNGIHPIVANQGYLGALPQFTGFHLCIYDGQLFFTVGDGTNYTVAKSVSQLSTNTWYHVVAQRVGNQASAFKLFVNGAQISTITEGAASLTSGNIDQYPIEDLKIGSRYNTYDHESTFAGEIQEVRFYKRQLSSSEVLANYNNGCAGVITDQTALMLWAPLNEGQGASATDRSSYATPGTFSGSGLTWTQGMTSSSCLNNTNAICSGGQFMFEPGTVAMSAPNSTLSVSCSALQTSLSQYISQYGNAAMSNTAQVTSYMNTSLSQSFSDQQYQAAFKNCNLTTAYANFNGSGFITFGKQPQYQVGTNDFSVEAWINFSNGNGNHPIAANQGYLGALPQFTGFHLCIYDGQLMFVVGDGTNYTVAKSLSQLSTNTWYHVVAQRIGNQASAFKLFVNGAQISTVIEGAASLTSGNIDQYAVEDLKIGSRYNSYDNGSAFAGEIQEVRFYKRQLSPSEVLANYNNGCAGVITDQTALMLWAPLNEGLGNSVTDRSSYAQQGTFSGSGLTWTQGMTSSSCRSNIGNTAPNSIVNIADNVGYSGVTRRGNNATATHYNDTTFIDYDVQAIDFVSDGVHTTQNNLIGQVARTKNGNATTWYSYDEFGHVEWTKQNIIGLGNKTVDYTYDFLGNVLQVAYQKGQSDAFYHHYTYNADGKLTDVSTSFDGVSKTAQAKYKYYLHGPLKRVELGTNLQGIDYIYNIDGSLKAINHPDPNFDPGADGISGANASFVKDAFGMALDYYSNDYKPATTNTLGTLNPSGYSDQFSGLIKTQRWHSQVDNHQQKAYAYNYDNLNRFSAANWGSVGGSSGNYNFTPATPQSYKEAIGGYDKNGNIQTLNRKDKTGTTLGDYSYNYTYTANKNQLASITGSTTVNYSYNSIGQMTQQSEGGNTMKVFYNAYGLTKEVRDGSDNLMEQYFYDDRGDLVKKIIYNAGVLLKTTFYVRDATGNPLAIYEQNGTNALALVEQPIYGSGRIGMMKPKSGAKKYFYEVSDHLGNVRAVIGAPSTDAPLASYESATDANFLRYDNARKINATLFNHTGGGSYSERLNATANEKYGIARSLSVMPGDTVKLEVYAKYVDSNTSNWTAALNTLMGQIAANTSGVVVDGVNYNSSTTSFPFANLLNTGSSTGAGPKAYLNWLVFDRNFVFTDGGYIRMSDVAKEYGQNTAHEKLSKVLTVNEPSYVYAYLSNENDTPVEVYFDDFKVTQVHDRIVAGGDYYPFGLQISERQISQEKYRFGYQGQFSEYDSLTKTNTFQLRLYDSRFGRWLSPDPYGQYASPYVGMGDNPVSGSDPNGGICCLSMTQIAEDFSMLAEDGLRATAISLEGASSMATLLNEVIVRPDIDMGIVKMWNDFKPNVNVLDIYPLMGMRVMDPQSGWGKVSNTLFGTRTYSDEIDGTKYKVDSRGYIDGPQYAGGTVDVGLGRAVQFTKSSLQLGQQMHKAYKVGAEGAKEFRLLSGKRIDFLDIKNATIFELKPFNPRAMQAGQKQLQMYLKELQSPAMLEAFPRLKGINWKTVLDVY